ncbi:MarR family winged helix-turn-helix transcriptional regulator [Nocardia sp. NPDC004278]
MAERRKDQRDRRSYAVHITASGRERLDAANRTADAVVIELLAPFSDAERRQLHELLGRFIEHAAGQS